jgi:TM2 domain-containing membrane protein YozV
MNCQNHPEVPATAYCRSCGKPVCEACRRDAYGTVFCAEHTPAPATAGAPGGAPNASVPPPFTPPPPPPGMGGPYGPPPPGSQFMADVSPGLAFFLGWIPGVGAIYNGQYAKGLVHAVLWGVLVSVTANSSASRGLEPLFGMLIAVWEFYMAFEAYHTARKRRIGEPVDEYSSLIDLKGGRGQVPVAGIALIVLGILLLLHTLDLLNFEYVARYWPVLLIAAGAYLLYGRFTHVAPEEGVRHERQ